MKDYQYLLLDLDGTIIDSADGIINSLEHVFKELGVRISDRRELYRMIGPPLKDSFKEYYGFSEGQAMLAQKKYREQYAKTGVFENRLYDGIVDFLKRANQKGLTVMIATSKPTVFAEQIMQYFNLGNEFAFIGGSDLAGSRKNKADVIRYVLHSMKISDPDEAVMIGDRKYDITGAKETGIDSIGVLYGYGSYEELSDAGADYIVENVKQLEKLLNIKS